MLHYVFGLLSGIFLTLMLLDTGGLAPVWLACLSLPTGVAIAIPVLR